MFLNTQGTHKVHTRYTQGIHKVTFEYCLNSIRQGAFGSPANFIQSGIEKCFSRKINEEKGKGRESKENFDSLAGDYLNSEIGRY